MTPGNTGAAIAGIAHPATACLGSDFNLANVDLSSEYAKRREYPDGWSRDDEIASARRLFEGFTTESGARSCSRCRSRGRSFG